MSKEIIPIQRIAQSIRLLRGQKVMLDFDLARLYGVTTKILNQAVKRNHKRFPADFMFRLSAEETGFLRSQFVTSSDKHRGATYRPYAFTEQGVAMLSSVLNSDRAVKVDISIMRAFVRLREELETNRELARKFAELEKRVGKHDEVIDAIISWVAHASRVPVPAPRRKELPIGSSRLLMAPAEKRRREIGFHVRERAPRYESRRRA